MPLRREFLAQLGGIVAASSLNVGKLEAMGSGRVSEWDTSWVERIAAAKYRVVFNANVINDGGAVYSAALVLDQFYEVYGISDQSTCPVIVFRSAGTAMAFNDSIWARYKIGDQAKVNDPATQVSATRNIFWKARDGASPKAAASSISALQERGLICLVCNRALSGWANEFATKTQQKEDTVYAEMRANLIPGAYLVPSGIFALIRAQNAGCAYMPGE